jgi:hypothetical protein
MKLFKPRVYLDEVTLLKYDEPASKDWLGMFGGTRRRKSAPERKTIKLNSFHRSSKKPRKTKRIRVHK